MDTSHFLSPSPSSKEYSEKRLAADSRTCDIYNLVPNTTYFIQVAAYNKLGPGEFNSQMTTTKPLDEVHKTLSFVQTSESGRYKTWLLYYIGSTTLSLQGVSNEHSRVSHSPCHTWLRYRSSSDKASRTKSPGQTTPRISRRRWISGTCSTHHTQSIIQHWHVGAHCTRLQWEQVTLALKVEH